MARKEHPEWGDWEWLVTELPYGDIPDIAYAKYVYVVVLKRITEQSGDGDTAAFIADELARLDINEHDSREGTT